MTVYVDDWRQPARVGRLSGRWSHMVGDDLDELHAFALRLGLRRSWFQPQGGWYPHYDVTESKRVQAVRQGAIAVSWRHLPRLHREGLIL
ncbi:DUF4031 domain-containing protein [Streptosporangium amethystogenes subsp. fukuiense]|uniref:DUF4031 domain-containing protein n=1 Tax=Streptosporangium amethystogenes subsp. fukuiense TaxID=698418 RepID=A0ABW2THK7_9ACTN